MAGGAAGICALPPGCTLEMLSAGDMLVVTSRGLDPASGLEPFPLQEQSRDPLSALIFPQEASAWN